MMIDPDAELVARVGRGDRAAAQQLMRRHLPKMLGKNINLKTKYVKCQKL